MFNRINLTSNLGNRLRNQTNNCSNLCFQNSKLNYIIEENKCVKNCSGNYSYEYNDICFNSCPNNTHKSSYNEYLCEDNLICETYFNYYHNECLYEIPDGFYLNDSFKKTIDKCPEECGKCNNESVNKSLCISCNNDLNFYPKWNENLDNNDFIKCYNNLSEDYYLENDYYMPCFNTCKSCNGFGNITYHNCISCKSDLLLIGSNCYENCEYFHYYEFNIHKCTENSECPTNFKLIEEKQLCIDNCSNYNENFKFEYNNRCYNSCPNETFYNYEQTKCISSIPDNYYLNDSEKRTINKCIDKCQNCSKESVSNNLCILCKNSEGYYPKYNDLSNYSAYIDCYKIPLEGHYFEKSSLSFKPCNNSCKKCNELGNENDDKCLEYYSNKNDISDLCLYKDKKNEGCLNECNGIDFFNNICKINQNINIYNNSSSNNNNDLNTQLKDNMIINIEKGIISHSMDELLNNLTKGDKNDLLIIDSDISYQITTTDNQNNNKYNNISTIILGECENILKDKYEIDPNKNLLIFKIDYYKLGSLIPIIGYEIYHPDTIRFKLL